MQNYTLEERKEFHREFVEEYIPFEKRSYVGSCLDLAEVVIRFCQLKKIETPLKAEDVRVGVETLSNWTTSPRDYLDFVFAVNAALLNWFIVGHK